MLEAMHRLQDVRLYGYDQKARLGLEVSAGRSIIQGSRFRRYDLLWKADSL